MHHLLNVAVIYSNVTSCHPQLPRAAHSLAISHGCCATATLTSVASSRHSASRASLAELQILLFTCRMCRLAAVNKCHRSVKELEGGCCYASWNTGIYQAPPAMLLLSCSKRFPGSACCSGVSCPCKLQLLTFHSFHPPNQEQVPQRHPAGVSRT